MGAHIHMEQTTRPGCHACLLPPANKYILAEHPSYAPLRPVYAGKPPSGRGHEQFMTEIVANCRYLAAGTPRFLTSACKYALTPVLYSMLGATYGCRHATQVACHRMRISISRTSFFNQGDALVFLPTFLAQQPLSVVIFRLSASFHGFAVCMGQAAPNTAAPTPPAYCPRATAPLHLINGAPSLWHGQRRQGSAFGLRPSSDLQRQKCRPR